MAQRFWIGSVRYTFATRRARRRIKKLHHQHAALRCSSTAGPHVNGMGLLPEGQAVANA